MTLFKKDEQAGSEKDRRGPKSTMRKVRTLSAACAVSAAVAVAGAGFGAYSTWQASNLVGSFTDRAQMEKTLVLTSAVAKGQTISEGDVALIDVPASLRVAGAVGEEGIGGDVAIVGRAALVDMGAGTQLTQAFAAGEGNKSSLSAAIEADTEAVSISVDAQSGLAGLVKVGDVVRVCAVSGESVGGDRSRTVAESARVVALDASLEAADGYSTVTVQVSPSEADDIRQSQADGAVSLVMKPSVTEE